MTVLVHMPSMLQGLYHTDRLEELDAGTVAEMASALNARYPGIAERLLEPDGSLRRYVNVFVEGEDGRQQAEASTPIDEGKQVWIVPNVAGGLNL